jgi:uncharacterized membrane protein YhhN
MFSIADLSLPPASAVYLLLASLPLLVISEATSFLAGHAIFKTVSSIAFLVGPLLFSEKSLYNRLITIGLGLSFVGDILLIPSRAEYYPATEARGASGKSASKREPPKEDEISTSFKLGVAAFASAHICYTIAFVQSADEIVWPIAASTFAAGVLAASLLGTLFPSPESSGPNLLNLTISGEMRPLVAAYVAIISTMLGVAAATSVPGAAFPRQRLLGAAMFAVSDAFVANDAFGKANIPVGAKMDDVRRGAWLKMLFGWGLYFWGQMILAGTVYA